MKRSLLVASLVCGATFLAAFAWNPWQKPVPPEDQVRRTILYSELPAAGKMRPPTASIDAVGRPERVRDLAFNEDFFPGDLDRETAQRLIDVGEAESLRRRLAPAARDRLQTELAPLELALTEAAAAAAQELDAVKAKLIDRPDRAIAIEVRPREKDPAYARVEEARRDIESKGLGAVWGDVIDGREVHFVIRWAEWPILKALRDEQTRLIVRRREAIARWIGDEFDDRGMDLFSDDTANQTPLPGSRRKE